MGLNVKGRFLFSPLLQTTLLSSGEFKSFFSEEKSSFSSSSNLFSLSPTHYFFLHTKHIDLEEEEEEVAANLGWGSEGGEGGKNFLL